MSITITNPKDSPFSKQIILRTKNTAYALGILPCSVHSFTDRGVSIGNKNVPDRVRFTRALLESKDLSMWFFFPCEFGSPGLAPAPWKQPLRKDLQDPLFPEAGMWGS